MKDRVLLPLGITLDVLLLPGKQFWGLDAEFYAKPDFEGSYSFDDFVGEKRGAEHHLRTELSRRWAIAGDFEVGLDTNIAFTMCGGIYSRRIMCCEYLEAVYRCLQATPMKEKWMYDTSLELQIPFDGMSTCIFRIRDNTVFVNMDDIGYFDFVRAFSASCR